MAMQVTEELVWELFTQGGPVVNVYLPKDRVTNAHQGYGFVEFHSEEDSDYVSLPCMWRAAAMRSHATC